MFIYLFIYLELWDFINIIIYLFSLIFFFSIILSENRALLFKCAKGIICMKWQKKIIIITFNFRLLLVSSKDRSFPAHCPRLNRLFSGSMIRMCVINFTYSTVPRMYLLTCAPNEDSNQLAHPKYRLMRQWVSRNICCATTNNPA